MKSRLTFTQIHLWWSPRHFGKSYLAEKSRKPEFGWFWVLLRLHKPKHFMKRTSYQRSNITHHDWTSGLREGNCRSLTRPCYEKLLDFDIQDVLHVFWEEGPYGFFDILLLRKYTVLFKLYNFKFYFLKLLKLYAEWSCRLSLMYWNKNRTIGLKFKFISQISMDHIHLNKN